MTSIALKLFIKETEDCISEKSFLVDNLEEIEKIKENLKNWLDFSKIYFSVECLEEYDSDKDSELE